MVHTGFVGRDEQNPEMPVRFYRTEAGGSPVLDWLRGLDKDDRHAIGLDLMRVQFGWPIGRPLVASLKDGLWEVRSSLPSKREARVLFGFYDGMLIDLTERSSRKSRRRPRANRPLRSNDGRRHD